MTGPADVTRTLTDAMERAGVHPAYVRRARWVAIVSGKAAEGLDPDHLAGSPSGRSSGTT